MILVHAAVFQAMEVNGTSLNSSSTLSVEPAGGATASSNPAGTFELPAGSSLVNQDVSLHQASLPSCSQDFPQMFPPQLDSLTPRPVLPGLVVSSSSPSSSSSSSSSPSTPISSSSTNSSHLNSSFAATFLQPTQANATPAPASALPDLFGSLLEESMLDEISLLDLAMEEGFSQAQASQLEDELDSDSGLSLDSGRSPASPSSSETSCCSSSAASSSSTSATFSEEGAVGYSTDSEAAAAEAEEGGAAGGYQPGYSKLCRMSYQDPAAHLHGLLPPLLDGVGHNHTYNLPLPSPFAEEPDPPKKKVAASAKQSSPSDHQHHLLDKHASRDERRARAMKIPFSNEKIVNLPVEEFNELLAKHRLSDGQLALVRDIRRRGKNKMAAQNCRKRKLDTIVRLEQGVQELRRDKARLLKEKVEFLRSIRQVKQKVQSLYQEVLAQLRDEQGRPYPPGHFSLQYGADGSVLVMPRGGGSGGATAAAVATGQQSRKPEKKQKDKKK